MALGAAARQGLQTTVVGIGVGIAGAVALRKAARVDPMESLRRE